jgi:hypothetical protein
MSIEKEEHAQNEPSAIASVSIHTIETMDLVELNKISEPVTSIFINSTAIRSSMMNETISAGSNSNSSISSDRINSNNNDRSWMSLERNQSYYNRQLPLRRHSIATATVTIATTPTLTEYTAPLINTITAPATHQIMDRSLSQQEQLSSSPPPSPLQRSSSVMPPTAVRQHNIVYAWDLATSLFAVNGPFLILYLVWSVCQVRYYYS